ncbi:MAG: rhomboid family intramembrane serine protease [Chloroflexota bacterium]|nr:rhomboid family intramembrane serine protease [Chloroflexota bacterium]MDQ5866882.1 rhomboid family intramembrane serine protease [Chloroflexota bacterium]
MDVDAAPSTNGPRPDLDRSSPEPLAPWLSATAFPERPIDAPFGYMQGDKPVGCTYPELFWKIARDKDDTIRLVWAPEHDRFVVPEEVPTLFLAVKMRAEAHNKRSLWSTALWAAVLSLPTLLNASSSSNSSSITGRNWQVGLLLLLMVGVFPAAQTLWELRKLKSYTPEKMAAQSVHARYIAWISKRNAWTTIGIACGLLLIALFEVFVAFSTFWKDVPSPIEAAGLVKSAVREGEWWRLVTAEMLHANLWHIIFNLTALYVLGTLVERVGARAYVSLVFLVSAVTASLFSVALVPDTTSIGASGAIMGLLGFAVVLSYLRKEAMPGPSRRAMLVSLGLIAALGLFGAGIIDNAAHLGGFLGGAGLGLLLVNRREKTLPLSPPRYIDLLGWAATATLVAFALFGVWRMAQSLTQ